MPCLAPLLTLATHPDGTQVVEEKYLASAALLASSPVSSPVESAPCYGLLKGLCSVPLSRCAFGNYYIPTPATHGQLQQVPFDCLSVLQLPACFASAWL